MTRLLFVTEADAGGSPRSQRELAHQLVARGHTVQFLAVSPRVARFTRAPYDALSDASVRFENSLLAPLLRRLRGTVGTRQTTQKIEGLPYARAAIVANALPRAIRQFRPDVVVANSVERWAWRQIHEVCTTSSVPTILYVREDDSLQHLDSGCLPDVLVANAESLTNALRSKGFECHLIPSVVDTSVTLTTTSRQRVLAINPIPSRGGAIFWAVAERLPHIPFVMQEAWPLEDALLRDTIARADGSSNVEFRRQMAPGPQLYADAKLLMVPYRVNNRPRVILESQANGIPVVVGDVPALVEATGRGGVSVPLDNVDAWVETIDNLWHDETRYEALVKASLAQSRRPDVDPQLLTDQFETLVDMAVNRSHGPRA